MARECLRKSEAGLAESTFVMSTLDVMSICALALGKFPEGLVCVVA